MVVEEKQKLWFRAKRYGYGWYPATWQGWGVLLMYLFALLSDALYSTSHARSATDFVMTFLPRVFIMTTFLIIIADAKGEPARWRWGK